MYFKVYSQEFSFYNTEVIALNEIFRSVDLTLEAVRGMGVQFFGFKFLLLDRSSKALVHVQQFFVR